MQLIAKCDCNFQQIANIIRNVTASCSKLGHFSNFAVTFVNFAVTFRILLLFFKSSYQKWDF